MIRSFIGIERWRSLKKRGTYSNDLVFLGSSKSIGVLIGMALTPILTRIYSPEQYGEFAFFNAILQPLSLLATLHFPMAFVLPEKDEDFRKLFRGSFSISVFTATSLFILGVFLWSFDLSDRLGITFPSYWWLLLGPGVFLFAFTSLLTNWNIRLKTFRKAAPIGLISRVSIKGSSILFGYSFGAFSWGLLLGEFIGKILQSTLLVIRIFRKELVRVLSSGFRKNDLYFSFRKFWNYPRYILPGSLLNQFSGHLVVYSFMFAFSPEVIGSYTLAVGMLNVPVGVLTGTVEPILTKRIRELHYEGETERIRALGREYFSKVFWIGIIPVICLYLFGEPLFALLFGNEWILAGAYGAVIGWFVLYRTMSAPLKVIYRVFGREYMVLTLSRWVILARLLGLSIGIYLQEPFIAIVFVALFDIVVYLYHSWSALKIVDADSRFFIGKYAMYGVISFSFAHLTHQFLFAFN